MVSILCNSELSAEKCNPDVNSNQLANTRKNICIINLKRLVDAVDQKFSAIEVFPDFLAN